MELKVKGKRPPSRQQKPAEGFTLIEVLLVIGAVSVLSLASFVVYPMASEASKAKGATNDTVAVVAGVERMFSRSAYRGLNNDLAIKAQLVPRKYLDGDGANISTAWGGSMMVGSAGTADRGWGIIYDQVPNGLCRRLVSGLSSSFSVIMINDQAVKAASMPLTPVAIVNACEDVNVLAFGRGNVGPSDLMVPVGEPDMGIPGDESGPSLPGEPDMGIPGDESGPSLPSDGPDTDMGIPGGGVGETMPLFP